jgi:hypothetical protein
MAFYLRGLTGLDRLDRHSAWRECREQSRQAAVFPHRVALHTMLFIVHSGQTGVERGAHEAGRTAKIPIAGFMPADGRDEIGLLPEHVSERLTVCPERGPRPPIKANIEIASAALIVVPDAKTAEQFPAMLWIIQRIRARRLPVYICDPTWQRADLGRWAASLPSNSGSVRLLVTGPRATRWQDGEQLARQLVLAIAVACDHRSASLTIGESICMTH